MLILIQNREEKGPGNKGIGEMYHYADCISLQNYKILSKSLTYSQGYSNYCVKEKGTQHDVPTDYGSCEFKMD